MLNSKNLTKDSIWQTWHDVNEDEFWAFIGVILNMGTMPISNIQEYWSTKHNSRIPFFFGYIYKNSIQSNILDASFKNT